MVGHAGLREALARTGMDRKNDGDFGGDGINGAEEFVELIGGIDIGRPVQRENGKATPVLSFSDAEFFPYARLLSCREEVAKRVDHDVADEEDGFPGTTFLEQMLDSVVFRHEEIVRESVGKDTIDLFGHGAVKAAEAGFDMGYAHAEFDGSEGDGDGGIDVADDEHEIRLTIKEDRLDALEDLRGLRGVGAGADLEINVGGGNAHLAKKDVVQFVVVMLAGMDEKRLDVGVAFHFAHERRDLGKVGASPNDIHDFEAVGHFPSRPACRTATEV